MDVLIKLIWIGDTSEYQGFHRAYQDKEGDGIGEFIPQQGDQISMPLEYRAQPLSKASPCNNPNLQPL
jgi:hypothetical protein